jgi:hypothetical protein
MRFDDDSIIVDVRRGRSKMSKKLYPCVRKGVDSN